MNGAITCLLSLVEYLPGSNVRCLQAVYALKDIQPGEEIVTTYVSLDSDSATRNRQLMER